MSGRNQFKANNQILATLRIRVTSPRLRSRGLSFAVIVIIASALALTITSCTRPGSFHTSKNFVGTQDETNTSEGELTSPLLPISSTAHPTYAYDEPPSNKSKQNQFSGKKSDKKAGADKKTPAVAPPNKGAKSSKEPLEQIYKIVDTKFGANLTENKIFARVVIQSAAGFEIVDLTGTMAEDGRSTLIDSAPPSPTRHRLMAQGYCANKECKLLILNVYYKIGSQTYKQQFVSDKLLGSSKKPNPATEPVLPNTPDSLDQSDEGTEDDNSELNLSPEQLGEYVGAEPNTKVLKNLWKRPVAPKLLAPSPPTPAPKSPAPAPAAPSSPAPPTTAPAAPPLRPPPPTTNSGPTVPPKKAPVAPPTAPPIQPPAAANTDTTAGESETEALTKLKARELELGPYLNLYTGGRAIGSPDHGLLANGSPLENSDPSMHIKYPMRDTHWGTGLLVDLILQIARHVYEKFPGSPIIIKDLSLKKGGHFGHSSHQNGLDIDISYIGNVSNTSIVKKSGRVAADFDFSRTWQFLRLAASQKILDEGQETTVLNRVFMNPTVKLAYCQWAKLNKITDNPFDADIMRRIRPTSGHKEHFHLRLKCSPHYPECRKQVEPPPGTGC
jgi:penicillin-insensitive murein endopeptidase